MLLYCIAIVSLLFSGGYGRSAGPPISNSMYRDRICDQLLPNHGANPRAGNGGYFILSNLINNGGAYTAGQSYSLQLLGATNAFLGFLIQAREGANYIGNFTNLPFRTQTLGCDASNPAATVTHRNPGLADFTALNFTWQAPSDSDGTVTFMYTVVQAYSIFYTALDAAQERPPTPAPTAVPSNTALPSNTAVPSSTVLTSTTTPTVPSTTPTVPSTTPTVPSTTPTVPSTTPTVPSTTMPPPALNFVKPESPNVPPEAYRFTSRIPVSCTPTVDCSFFVGIQTNTNSSFLDIYLEGESEGWVAVGFSPTPSMFMADVLGCNRMAQTDNVHVVDTWNTNNPQRFNVLDANQDGVYAHSTGFANGRISCNFSRFIGVVNPDQDLNLNGEYFLLFGQGATGGGMGGFPNHQPQIPTISASQVNPVTQLTTPTVPSTTPTVPSTTPTVPSTTPTVPSTTMPPPALNFVKPESPNVLPEAYRLTSRIPAGCTPTVNCSYFVGIQTNTNSSFLDIYLEGVSEGWVAVGFSPTPSMFMADVLGCNRMAQTDNVHVVDTWNTNNRPRGNVLDANQEGVFVHSAEIANGRLSCNFSRFIGVVNPDQDLNLNGEYFLLFGRGAVGAGMGNFPYHRSQTPTISSSQVNPVSDEGPTISASRICVISFVLLSLNSLFLL